MAITNEYQPSNIRMKVVKGNELADLITEDFDVNAFQPTTDVGRANHGLHDGLDRDKVVRVKRQLAALGARGDYILLEYDTVATETTTWAMLVGSLFIDVKDYTGVPIGVQHTVFGKFTPFVTPKESIQESMLDGIDIQDIQVVHNVAVTVDGAEKAQKVRGSSDSRVAVIATGATAAVTKLQLKLKPNADGVFVVPRGARIWVGSGTPT